MRTGGDAGDWPGRGLRMKLWASSRNEGLVCRHPAEIVPVVVSRSGFALPDVLADRRGSVFLTLDVAPVGKGHFREPALDISRGEVSCRQYLDRGARGQRHLNLSSLFQGARQSRRIELRSDSARWSAEGTLSLFESPALTADTDTIVVVAPHPDDAEIAAFGLYADSPSRSWVVTITAGEQGAMSLARVVGSGKADEDAYWKASLRVWDSLTIPQLNGLPAERSLNLVYPDGKLEAMARDPARPFRLGCEPGLSRDALRARNRHAEFQGGPAKCTWSGLVEELCLVLETAKPAVVVCPHPLVDNHPDHVFATVALEAAVRRSTQNVPTFLLYVVHARQGSRYPFGLVDGVASVAPCADGQWIADSIYSHGLTPERQRAKYFAVEAHHDVRTYTDGAPKTFRQVLGALKREALAFGKGAAVDPSSLFVRRAARPNELYYVVSTESLSGLVRRVRPVVSRAD